MPSHHRTEVTCMFHARIKPLAIDTASVSGDSNTAEFALLVRAREVDAGGKRRSDRVGVGFAGANTYRMVDAVHEDLAVTDLSGFRGRDDCLDDLVHLIG